MAFKHVKSFVRKQKDSTYWVDEVTGVSANLNAVRNSTTLITCGGSYPTLITTDEHIRTIANHWINSGKKILALLEK